MNYYEAWDSILCALAAILLLLVGMVIGGAGMFLLLYR